jgi:hypothetical protein
MADGGAPRESVDPCDEFVGSRTGKPKAPSSASMRRETEVAVQAVRSGDWSGARPLTFVALHAWLHERVYGVPYSPTPDDRLNASRAAGRMLKADFRGDAAEMAAFMRWCWRREREREEWRRQNGRSGGSIGWRLQFGPHLLTDYRIDLQRQRR